MPCHKEMSRCYAQCLHRDMVMGYRCARVSSEQERERVTMGYPAEEAEYDEKVPRTTFKRWLQDSRRPDDISEPT